MALTKSEACHPDVWVNLACCYFFLGMYKEGDEMAQKGIVTCMLGVQVTELKFIVPTKINMDELLILIFRTQFN